MYSFAQRRDFSVLDEPFYASYLTYGKPEVAHPEHELILNTMEPEEAEVVKKIELLSKENHVFVKGMAHHYLTATPAHILEWDNVILIRHPKKLIASFSKVIKTPALSDIGIKKASELFLFLKKSNKTPVVIDSDELLKNPENYLKKLCSVLDIPFSEAMLSWKKGGIQEDGVWAAHWYRNVHNSEGFSVQKSSSQPLPDTMKPLLEEAMPYYETLKNNILKND
jgi:hypothetical protein